LKKHVTEVFKHTNIKQTSLNFIFIALNIKTRWIKSKSNLSKQRGTNNV